MRQLHGSSVPNAHYLFSHPMRTFEIPHVTDNILRSDWKFKHCVRFTFVNIVAAFVKLSQLSLQVDCSAATLAVLSIQSKV